MLGLGLLLGAEIWAWLSLAALYWLLEPAQRASSAPLIVAVAAPLAGLVLGARRLFGREWLPWQSPLFWPQPPAFRCFPRPRVGIPIRRLGYS